MEKGFVFPRGRILVATDGSENANKSVQVAIALAKQSHSELVILTAVTSPVHVITSAIQSSIPDIDYSAGHYKETVERASNLVEESVRQAEKAGVAARGVVDRSVSTTVEAIVGEAVSSRADLIVVGTRGLSGFRKFVVGSVSGGVLAHAPCSVLIVK